MPVETVIPWESPEWDDYVASHPAAGVFHTSVWCRIVAELGRYRPVCLVHRTDGKVTGVLPAMEIRSRLTGNRLGALPFSDDCFVLADDAAAATELIRAAMAVRDERRLERFEMRGAPAIGADNERNIDLAVTCGMSPHTHFFSYLIPLHDDIEAIRMTFQRKLRQAISKSLKNGVTVNRVDGDDDLREVYRLYVLNRRQHGIPPQPFALYQAIARSLTGEGGRPEVILHLANLEGVNIASLVTIRYRGVATAKYEGIDPQYRSAMPIHPLLWTSIREAAEAGDHTYDLGRTAMDNVGLSDFKRRWGTRQEEVPYLYYPDSAGLSVVRRDSLKYRVFTGLFQRLPAGATAYLGGRIFRHFG